ncbi:hypothetical protein OHAE_115 [Ochrobactrum soli]|uniref:Uncharacterized protein n=1 Tax=Ochrobactrum soli TaxID=2448455 RepID=A0A2P9HJG4_9HYPH|nr:hypothetical protein OHAE_115 [[Ochrobactrum] soli]
MRPCSGPCRERRHAVVLFPFSVAANISFGSDRLTVLLSAPYLPGL